MKLPALNQPDEETETTLRFLPGYAFFCRTLPMPEELEGAEETQSFAELSLESLSPFPLDQLAWGYLVDDEARQIFLYAACRPRLPVASQEGWEEAHHVFPSFFPLLLEKNASAPVLALEDNDSCTLLRFNGAGRFPAQVVSAPYAEEADTEARQILRQRLLARLKGAPAEATIYRLEKSTATTDSLRFALLTEGAETPHEVRLEGEEALWAADVREDDFIVAERRRRKAAERVGWALAGAGVAFALLVLLVLLTWVGDWMVSRRASVVNSQDAAAYKVQQNSDFLLQLEQFSGEPFRPFVVLAAANQVLQERQPRRIEFTSASLTSKNEVSIQGQSTNVEEVNLFSERLRQSGYFTEVLLADVRTRGGKVNFSLNLRFNPEALPQLLAIPEPETAAVNETESTQETTSEELADAAH